jgi:ABC-type Mn2+/Zn2+ transport system permease subunit
VFSYLIVPLVCSTLLGWKGAARLYWAWGLAFVVSILGAVLSYFQDWPMGATIVCLFGVMVAGISIFVRVRNGVFAENAGEEVAPAPAPVASGQSSIPS